MCSKRSHWRRVLSIVQLVNRLTLLGWDAKIATHHDHNQEHLGAYMLYHHPYVFPSARSHDRALPRERYHRGLAVVHGGKVKRIVSRIPKAVPWYFVQDDERIFFHELDVRGDSRSGELRADPEHDREEPLAARTNRRAGASAEIVPVGFDLDSFYTYVPHSTRSQRILAMARPRTPRRGFERTVRVLREVKKRHPELEVAFFGCSNLDTYGLDFEYTDLGEVPNERLRALYNTAQIVLDLSDYQALGRIGLEGMACGAATVLTRFGGINEYIRDGENTLAVDVEDEPSIISAVLRLVEDDALRSRLVQEGYATVQRFSCDNEVRATSRLFAESLGYPDGLPAEFALSDDSPRTPGEGTSPIER